MSAWAVTLSWAVMTAVSVTSCRPAGTGDPVAVQSAEDQMARPSGTDGKPMNEPVSSRAPAGWSAYADPAYGFRLHVPDGYVVRRQDVARFREFTPTPVSSTYVMNPTMAAGDLAGLEPPDLEVRVYATRQAGSLETWLTQAGFAFGNSGTHAQPHVVAGMHGLKVCQSTMIAPGCSLYVLRGERVYQLTAMSAEGEAMAGTFRLVP